MKFTVGLAVLVSALALVSAVPECSIALDGVPDKWVTMAGTCTEEMEKQIQMEIGASYAYLEMAAYFSRDTVNRPGFAELFFNAAREEREHGIKLIEYLSMRGELTKTVTNLINVPTTKTTSTFKWSGVSALTNALELETKVTEAIRKVISICEGGSHNDYHLVDYLSGVYLEEQYKGQREIAGRLATLKKMEQAQGVLAEFLFDKELL